MTIEVRADQTVHIEGYVNVPGRDSRPLRDSHGVYIEQVTPGTFGRALARGGPVELRYNHQRTLGSTGDGTLDLREDAVGLHARASIRDHELAEKARQGELRGWSFGFVAQADRWEAGEPRRRYLEDIELREVSILDKTPAYIATSLEVRGEDTVLLEYRSCEAEPELRIPPPEPPAEPAPPAGIPVQQAVLEVYRRRRRT